MEKTKTYYTGDLIEGAIEELQDRLKYQIRAGHYADQDDLISEIADNNIPIYTYDLLQYASNNFDLIEQSDLCPDCPNVTQIITANIYEVLTEALYEYINEPNKE